MFGGGDPVGLGDGIGVLVSMFVATEPGVNVATGSEFCLVKKPHAITGTAIAIAIAIAANIQPEPPPPLFELGARSRRRGSSRRRFHRLIPPCRVFAKSFFCPRDDFT